MAPDSRLRDYLNVRPVIGSLISTKMASLLELQAQYGVKDAYDMLEVLSVDSHNQRVMNQRED